MLGIQRGLALMGIGAFYLHKERVGVVENTYTIEGPYRKPCFIAQDRGFSFVNVKNRYHFRTPKGEIQPPHRMGEFRV